MARNRHLGGQRFARWQVISLHKTGRRRSWLCRCDCGTVRPVLQESLLNGKSRSCDCLKGEMYRDRFRKHGRSGSPESRLWNQINQRCNNPKNPGWKNYGGRGITICPRWLESSVAFLEDIGPRPTPKHSFDRIDNDGGYWCGKPECPGCGPLGREPNCRWATRKEQNKNKRPTYAITFRGETRCLAEWCELLGMKYEAVRVRISELGWDVERAMTTPIRSPGHGRRREPHVILRHIRTGIIDRCYNPKARTYRWYGAKGVTVCRRWRDSPSDFIADIGPRPSAGHSVDRIDPSLGYWCGRPECPECGPQSRRANCRWATRDVQAKNRGKQGPPTFKLPRVLTA